MLWLDQLKQSDHKHLLLTLEGEESPDINQKENVVTSKNTSERSDLKWFRQVDCWI